MLKRISRTIKIATLIAAALGIACAIYGHFQITDNGEPQAVAAAGRL